MRSVGNNFSYFTENKLTKLAVQLKHMLIFCLEDWGLSLLGPLVYATDYLTQLHLLATGSSVTGFLSQNSSLDIKALEFNFSLG